MAGRKPKPIAQQIAEGDPRQVGMGKLRDRLDRQVQPTRGLPDCPRQVRGVARKAWRFWTEELQAMNLDSRPDAMMLEGACVNYARAVNADQIVHEKGAVVEEPIADKNGIVLGHKVKTNPAVHVSNQAWRLVRAFCSEFGLSPVSRMRLTIEKPDTATQDLMEMLSRPRERKSATVQ